MGIRERHHEQHQQEPQQKHRRHHNGENSGHIFKRSLVEVGGPKTVPTFRARKRTHPEKTYGPVFSGRVRFWVRIPGSKKGPYLFSLKYLFLCFNEIPVGQAPCSLLLHAATSCSWSSCGWRLGLECAAIAVVAQVRVVGDGLLVAEGGQRWRQPSWGQPVHVASWRGRASWRKLMMMERHTAPAHAEGGEGLNLSMCPMLR